MKLNKHYFLLVIWVLSNCYAIHAQSNDQNYIRTRTMLSADGSKYLDEIQYLDGLGRPVQTVQKGITSQKSDLVSYLVYDEFGRESKSWIPTPVSGNDGSFVTDFITKANSYHNNNNPYSEIYYESSPLNRVIKQLGPGINWHSADKGIRTEYLTNEKTGITSAIFYKINSNGTLTKDGTYNKGELFVEKMTDEDGNPVYTFTDKLGQLILSRKINQSNGADEYHDTYIVYDDLGNKRYALPPMIEGNITQENLDLYAYSYKYDERKRCIEKKLPGCEPVKMLYDMSDRLVMSQTGTQRAKEVWTVNKYDRLGRLLYTSEVKVWEVIEELRKKLFTYSMLEKFSTGPLEHPMEDTGYSRNNFDIHPTTLLTVNYYDNYDFLQLLPGQDKEALTYQTKTGYDTPYNNAKGLLTGTRVYDLTDPAKFTTTAFYYDYMGNEVQVVSTNHLEGYEKNYYKRSFTGIVEQHLHEHTAKGKDKITELYTYSYDHAQRLLATTYKLNNNSSVTLSRNMYNELGQVKTRSLHGGKDATNYTYNIRNWLTKINGPRFKQDLYYDGYYNGNISRMTWETGDDPDLKRQYMFTYDNVNRLMYASYFSFSTQPTPPQPPGTLPPPVSHGYGSVHIDSYDKHGNIKRLKRSGLLSPPGFGSPGIGFIRGGVVDDLTLEYTGNQLVRVTDASPNDPVYKEIMHFVDGADEEVEYTYDANGSMKKDLNKGITSIEYNLLNLPANIYFKGNYCTNNRYDAAGNKYRIRYLSDIRNEISVNPGGNGNGNLQDSIPTSINPSYPGGRETGISGPATLSSIPTGPGGVSNGSVITQPIFITKTTIDYCGNIIYKDGELDKILIPEGYVDKNKYDNFVYHYYLRDHQGNNRIVMNQSGEIEQVNHYYPFGGLFGDSQELVSNQSHKYNGKELDRMYGLDLYDYHKRMYDSMSGRFPTMDPLSEMYYDISPYAYCNNNPVRYVDPDGRDWYENKEGNMIYDINIRSQKDLEKSGIEGSYYNISGTKNDIYYSAFGTQYDANSKEGKTMEKIDEALYKYFNSKMEYNNYGDLITKGEISTNFDIGIYPTKSFSGSNISTYFSFDFEGGLVTYFMVDKGIPNKAKFGGFGYISRNQSRGNSSWGSSKNLKDGYSVYFERDNTSGNKVVYSSQIVFPSLQLAKDFETKSVLIFKNR